MGCLPRYDAVAGAECTGVDRPTTHVGGQAVRRVLASTSGSRPRRSACRHLTRCGGEPSEPGAFRSGGTGVGGLEAVAALHAPPTPRAVADLKSKSPHDGAHPGEFFLILRGDAGHFDAAAAVSTYRHMRTRHAHDFADFSPLRPVTKDRGTSLSLSRRGAVLYPSASRSKSVDPCVDPRHRRRRTCKRPACRRTIGEDSPAEPQRGKRCWKDAPEARDAV